MTTPTLTETAERARPEDVGLDPVALERIESHLRRRYLDPGKIVGCLTLISRGGRIGFLSTLGLQDRERNLELSERTLFRIYSMTKPITSVALMMLYEEGAFQLADAVGKFIPELASPRVYVGGNHPTFQTRPASREITVRDLLTHQSGLTYGFMERTNVDRAYRRLGVGGPPVGGSLSDMMSQLGDLPLEFDPGTAWNYSVATDVCGRLVEVFSGQTLEEFFRQRIFEPLGMTDTGFKVPAEKIERFAANYQRDSAKNLVLLDDPRTSHYTEEVTLFSGGGGLVSTALDYHRFCTMLLRGGELDGARLLGRKTVELMTRSHLPSGVDLTEVATGSFSEVTYEGQGFGLGFSVTLDPARAQCIGTAGDYGWGGAASTTFWNDPVEDLCVIFMVQFMPSGTFNFRGQLKSLIYPALR